MSLVHLPPWSPSTNPCLSHSNIRYHGFMIPPIPQSLTPLQSPPPPHSTILTLTQLVLIQLSTSGYPSPSSLSATFYPSPLLDGFRLTLRCGQTT
ncbi:hypothetical protein I7I53_06273 [Histoplasma capsulatum var. duboisii H88]|uniref:Uncharacterized protein n=1 Tax=Ajellomyces capsulatus (strain H88) TaxID=544711 RepID=A0A8A1LGE4_AJEC8|nr:hypothetical protein I7I53_06273 [Histoplasma capsulatum var. duboisii H88]